MSKFKKYYKVVNFLEGLDNSPAQRNYLADKHHSGIYLERMRYFLELLGNPDKDMKYIHIAGTSGKGTVTNMVHEILNIANKNVGSFTSPSVVTSIEKIKVKDKYIDPNEFARIVDYLRPFIEQARTKGPYGRLSYFEIFLAIALVYFKKQKCEYVILETGLGGKYDATNIIESPVITAITNIDYDHTELLGKTLKKIANDKAGIIKKNSIFFTAEQRPSLIKIFRDVCRKNKVSLNVISKQNSYQDYNKELVTAIAKVLGIADKQILKGIDNAKLMCRFEIIQDKPTVILDGAHNRSKIRTALTNLENVRYKKLYLIIGIAENKDHVSILKQIIPKADYIFFTTLKSTNREYLDPKNLFAKSKPYLKKKAWSEKVIDPNKALSVALKTANASDAILVVGSFFLAGQLRKYWYPEELILQKRRAF